MPMTREDWIDHRTGPHHDLDKIAAGSMMVDYHAKKMLCRPDWETAALIEMDLAVLTLRAALARIERARETYLAKAVDR
jgi:hypothetical protein